MTTPHRQSDFFAERRLQDPRVALAPSVRWFYILRFSTYALVMGAYLIQQDAPGLTQAPALLYSMLTLYLPLVALWPHRGLSRRMEQGLLSLQFFCEIIITAAVVRAGGAEVSPFAGLFYLTIISGALYYRLAGALIVAALVSSSHIAVILFYPQSAGVFSLSALVTAVRQAPDRDFYAVFLHTLTYILVAFVSGYFFERARRRDEQLSHTSKTLKRVRLQTDEIISRLGAGLITVDHEGHIILFNNSAEQILGIPEVQARGKDFRVVFTGGAGEFCNELEQTIANGQSRPRREVWLDRADGRRTPLGITTALIEESDDGAIGVIAIFQDISEAKIMEQRVRQSDRLLAVAELSAAIAHEIRNPLAAVVGSAEALSKELVLQGDDRRLMDLILKEGARLNRILTDFLTYARVGRTAYNKVDICHIVVEAFDMIRQHPSFDSTIEISFDPRGAVVRYVVGDDGQIKQIIFNLLLNALEAHSALPQEKKVVRVTIETSGKNEQVRLVVIDNGPGIAPESVESIFHPFFSTKKGGTGLGLAIANRLATAMGGSLTVESPSTGGAHFVLSLTPFADSQSDLPQSPNPSRLQAGSPMPLSSSSPADSMKIGSPAGQ